MGRREGKGYVPNLRLQVEDKVSESVKGDPDHQVLLQQGGGGLGAVSHLGEGVVWQF